MFICGMPAWGTLIALTRRGEPIYGMMYQPFTAEHFTGDGSAAELSWSGRRSGGALRTRRCADLEDAVLLTTSPLLMDEADRQTFQRVEKGPGSRAMAAIATLIACSPRATSISSSRPNSNLMMCCR